MQTTFETLIDTARHLVLYEGAVQALASELPQSDEELVSLLEETADRLEAEAFSHLWIAAHWAKRRVPGRLLADGAPLFTEMSILCATASTCSDQEKGTEHEGETVRALLAAAKAGGMGFERSLTCLALAILCWRSLYGEEKPLPEEIGFEARKHARSYWRTGKWFQSVQELLLNMLEHLLDDENIRQDLEEKSIRRKESEVLRFEKDFMAVDLASIVPKTKPPKVTSGYQVRRAVPKVGRNDPCHCGSGNKYKKCCFAADQEKLSRSSEIAGKTIDDLEEEKEERLTEHQVNEMRVHQIMKLDPARIHPDALPAVSRRLMLFDQFDAVLAFYDGTPHQDRAFWPLIFSDLLFHATKKHRVDLIDRILEICPEVETDYAEAIKFARAIGNRSALIDLVESRCREVLAMEEAERNDTSVPKRDIFDSLARPPSSLQWVELAYRLLESDCPHLGIAFARAVLPLAGLETELLVETIELTRDGLGLHPSDFSEELSHLCDEFDSKKFLESMEMRLDAKHSERLHQQARALEAKQDEYRKLHEALDEANKRNAALEKMATAARKETASPAKAANPAPATGEEILELRRKIHQLKSESHRVHEERNALRRELRKTKGELASQPAPSAESEDRLSEEENSLLEADDFASAEMPRIPVFPEKFLETKRSLPAHVVGSAMKLIGRLAAGDPSAFRGTRQLKSRTDCLRQKVGASYRLIFQIKGPELKVVDLIHRKDLERWLASHSKVK